MRVRAEDLKVGVYFRVCPAATGKHQEVVSVTEKYQLQRRGKAVIFLLSAEGKCGMVGTCILRDPENQTTAGSSL